ncbi:MAG TPA: NADH-quinone oxidoreductase subunit NuoN [Alphaproteobacteria bacterium]|nr:NADH-quinone oxidoreductase subunit NuoN [Alphaproteobacteria bacterium]HAJ46570.1 NADH-quinone oxidoreductase subunit NuoN [Alphaproteobacteria bacterium]
MTYQTLLGYLPAIMPELVLGGGIMLVLLYGVFRGERSLISTALLTLLVLCVAAYYVVLGASDARVLAFGGSVVIDPFASFLKLLILGASAVAMIMALEFLKHEKLNRFEYPVLIGLSALGMLIMVSANDLMVLYVGLEMQSLALYVLAAFSRDNTRSTEAGLKYFVLGALSSGMLLYGISLIYGMSGTLNFDVLKGVIETQGMSIGLVIGMVFLAAGLAFKISAAPFHMWTPDVYEGAPTPVTAFFAAAPKVAAMGLFLRVLFGPFEAAVAQWQQIIIVLSVASMTLGAFAAIGQSNIKRLMAYSSIGHVGFALLGFVAGGEAGVKGVLIYLAIYVAMTLGAFICILAMRREGRQVEEIADLSGLSTTQPGLALALLVLMFSMIGIPPFAGFWAKFYVFLPVVEQGLYWLAVVGFLASVVSAVYYLKILRVIYFDDPAPRFTEPSYPGNGVLLAMSVLFITFFIFWPAPLLNAAGVAASSLVK